MRGCKQCGSYATNPGRHGRDDCSDLDLCDVCYWRKRATALGTHSYLKNREQNLGRIAACVNACAGIEDPSKAIGEAREIIQAMLDCEIVEMPKRLRDRLESALAKLQPKESK